MFIFSFGNWVRFTFFVSCISHLVFRGGAEQAAGRAPSNIGGGCAFDAKKGFRHRRTRLVSRFWQVSKKNFEKMDFWFWVYAHLIEKLLDSA